LGRRVGFSANAHTSVAEEPAHEEEYSKPKGYNSDYHIVSLSFKIEWAEGRHTNRTNDNTGHVRRLFDKLCCCAERAGSSSSCSEWLVSTNTGAENFASIGSGSCSG
jgi:hypothetical protein